MEMKIEVEDYNPEEGLTMSFTGGGTVKITGADNCFSIRGNRVGFEDLATALLTLAHNEGVAHSSCHIHVDEHPMLAEGSSSIVVQYLSDE
tara:strand:+ start:106440 stop:106712 length:273 start_codon:yes stop_codon:yes gene_type:complete